MGQNASDVRAGGAFYELWGKDGLTDVLDRLQKRVLVFTSFMQRAGTRAGLAGGALSAPLTALFKGGMDRGAELARLNRQLGVPIEILNKMQYAADAAGVSLDEVMQDRFGRYSDLIARAPAIDPEEARAAAQTQLELADATRSVQLALLPLVKTVATYVKLFATFVKDNAGAARQVLAVGAGLVLLGVTLKLLAIGFAAVIPVANLAWLAISGPIGLEILLIGGIVVALMYLTDGFALLGSTARTVGATIVDMWDGIGAALAKGDIALAGAIALKGLEVLWLEFVDSATGIWNVFKGVVVDGWHDLGLGVALVMNDIWTLVERTFTALGDFVKKIFAGVVSTVLGAAIKVAEALDRLDPTGKLKGAIDWAKGVKEAADDVLRAGGADTSDIDDARDKRAEILEGDAAADKERRKKERLAARAEAMADLAKAKEELADLKKQAEKPDFGLDHEMRHIGEAIRPDLLGSEQVKGGFSGAALSGQLGYANETQKQTALLGALKDGNCGLPRVMGAEVGKQVVGAFKING